MKLLVIANWKMNPTTLAEAKKLFNSVAKGLKSASWRTRNVEVVICPPFVYVPKLEVAGSKLQLAGQDCFWEDPPAGGGAFTGEISSKMLKDLGCKYVIVGHSERRALGETDEMINKKIKAVLKRGLKPILCVKKISQIKKDIKGISKKETKKIVLAYEPVWAIGTGKACGIPEAKRVNLSIKKNLKRNILLYGGSVNSQNARDFIKKAGFQGLLIGGASLDPKEFIEIVKNVAKP